MKFSSALVQTALVVSAAALFDLSSKDNVVVYWGQGLNQMPLLDYCKQPSIDAVVLSFVHLFPAQANGFPGTDFGNQCSGKAFPGPGWNGVKDPEKDELKADCPLMSQDIATCQKKYGKKILLSLGGGVLDYQLQGAGNGIAFADQLWAMFGPRDERLVAEGMPRPFDLGGKAVELDGFDFDIEHPSVDAGAGYKAMANRLRRLYPAAKKPYYLTASPQCIVPDANMKEMISAVPFDALFIQFYNTPQCSAATWVAANPTYPSGGGRRRRTSEAGFTLDSWADYLTGTASKNARLFIGLPGGPSAASPSNYVDEKGLDNLYRAHACSRNLGGISIWDATSAEEAKIKGQPYFQVAKVIATYWARTNPVACRG